MDYMMKHDVKHVEYGQCKDDVFALWNTSVPVESVLEKNKEVKVWTNNMMLLWVLDVTRTMLIDSMMQGSVGRLGQCSLP